MIKHSRRAQCFLFSLSLLLCAGTLAAADSPASNNPLYPQLDIQGYKKYEYRRVDVDPIKNYFNALTQIGGFTPTYTGGPWQERLLLKITGKLSERLSVSYDLSQQPEEPDRYDVNVKYDNNTLTFGDLNANFTNNEFASTSKFCNGVMLNLKDSWYDVLFVPSAKVRSQNQGIVSQFGNNTRGPYSLGHGGLIENSERVELNGKLQARNKDYTIDYIEGKITFTNLITDKDEFKYSYEYTNIVDLFFPTLSKRDFFGLQGRVIIDPTTVGKKKMIKSPLIREINYSFPHKFAYQPTPIIHASGEALSSREAASSEEAVVQSVDSSVNEETSLGRYSLPFVPMVKFSETVTYKGVQLKRDEDYSVDYQAGKITLTTPDLPSAKEPVTIDYQYFAASREAESFKGDGGRGPYDLKGSSIMEGTENVYINNVPAVKDLDYAIDYDKKKILFTLEIGPATQIDVRYLSKVYEPEPPAPTPDQMSSLVVGSTFLRESAKKGDPTPLAVNTDIQVGADIIKAGNLIYLSKFPVAATTEASFSLKKDGVEMIPGVDYAFPSSEVDPITGHAKVTPPAKLAFLNDRDDLSDGLYTGTIAMLTPVDPASQYTISYSYKKGVVGKVSGMGTGNRGPYYIRNYRNLVPGIETVQVWDSGSTVITNYIRNSSMDADAGAFGYSISYYKDNAYIVFNEPLSTTKNYQIIFQYIPESGVSGQDISQDIFGVDGSFKMGDTLQVEGQYAHSRSDKVILSSSTSEAFNGNGGKTYLLHSGDDLVENSERVSINGRYLNKDSDYYINYTRPGQVVFFYLSPSSADAISVSYSYLSATGDGGGVTQQDGSALKLDGQVKFLQGKLVTGAALRTTNPDFQPLGSTPIGVGSTLRNANVDYNPRDDIGMSWAYRQTQDQLGSNRGYYLWGNDNNYSLKINPKNLVDIRLNLRDYWTMDDLIPGQTTHNNDLQQQDWGLTLTPVDVIRGPLKITNTNDLKRSYANTGYVDKISQTRQRSDYLRTSWGLSFTERAKLGYSYQISEPFITGIASDGATSVESHTLSRDTSYDLSLDLTPARIQKLTARLNLINHDGLDLTGTTANTGTKNEGFHVDFVPLSLLSTSYDRSRIETLTVLQGAQNPKSERTSANATLNPWSFLTVSWDGGWDDSILEIGAQSSGRSNQYAADYQPLTWSTGNVHMRFTLFDRDALAPSGSYEVNTNTNSFKQEYILSYVPISMVTITPSFIQEDYMNKDDNVTAPISTETVNQTLRCQMTVRPLTALDVNGNYEMKVTRDKVSSMARNRSVVGAGAVYRMNSWGNLNLGWQDEENGGEVQAGTIMDFDYSKITNDLSLSVTVPQDSSILSSIVLTATYRNVNYRNRKNPSDDFRANLLTFEGTLNF